MTFDPSTFGWPQWTILIIGFLNLMITASLHGKPRDSNYNGFVAVCGFALGTFILICGGFYA